MIRSCGLGRVPSRCLCRRLVVALHLEWEMSGFTDCVHVCIAHISSVGPHAPTAGFAMRLATNASTGMSAATNASLIADDRNDVA